MKTEEILCLIGVGNWDSLLEIICSSGDKHCSLLA